jgi:transglutaminase-like putative cysteine protease
MARTSILVLAVIAALAHVILSANPVALFSVAIVGLKVTLLRRGMLVPPRWIILPLTAIGVGLVFFRFGGWIGQYAGFALLVILLSLKLLESRSLRDYQFSCLLMYFLAAGQFLYHFSFLSIALVSVYCIAVTASLHLLARPTSTSPSASARLALGMIAKAVPLALILFLFFPRINASFGFLPGDDSANDGLSNSMAPGEISSSAFSTEVIFRAEFDGPPPPPAELYWRVKTMTRENNFGWELDRRNMSIWQMDKQRQHGVLNAVGQAYNILHEPTTDRFLPTLSYVSGTDYGRILPDHTLRDIQPPRKRISYRAASTRLSTEQKPDIFDPYLQTLSTPGEQTSALMEDWKRVSEDPEALISMVLMYFHEEPFNYSLIPPELGEREPMEEFLFETRSGYCEHYSSAFTTIMRWLGIPARIVTGYQGGEWNAAGDYMTIRYSDAHAWSEVWLEEKGWTRVDPTSVIAPERIEFGMDALLRLWESGRLPRQMGATALSDFLRPGRVELAWRTATDYWYSAEYKWTSLFIDFNSDMQREILRAMGLSTNNLARTLALVLTIGCALLTLIYLVWVLPRPTRLKPVERAYRKFCRKLARLGVARSPSEGPMDYGLRASAALPEKQGLIGKVTDNYILWRYGEVPMEAALINQYLRHI